MTNKELSKEVYVQQVKFCISCEDVKPLEGGYYKAGKSWQKRCIKCHNKKRLDYTNNTKYKHKITGFKKLPEELQKKIIYDVYVKINFKDIFNKYNKEYPQLKHQTLLRWNRAGQIPKFEEQ